MELAPRPDGRLGETARRRTTFSGEYRDATTGEELRVEDPVHAAPRVGYRTRVGGAWKRLEVVKGDRERWTLVVKFPKGPTTYVLTFGTEPSAALVSQGSDGSRRQPFAWVPFPERKD